MTTTPSVSPNASQPAAQRAGIPGALETVRRNITAFGDTYPDDTTTASRYLPRPAGDGVAEGGNRGWTTCFWPGVLWL
jgi:unsaturated chondroitin disaccharide hydrolase